MAVDLGPYIAKKRGVTPGKGIGNGNYLSESE